MPMVAAAAASAFAAIGSAIATTATALTFASGITAGLNAWATVASVASLASGLMAKPPKLESQGYDLKTLLAGPNAPIPVVFGRAAVPQQMVFREAGNRNNQDLYVGSVLSAGPISNWLGFYINNRQITWSGNPLKLGSSTGCIPSTGAVGLPSGSKLYRYHLSAAVTLGEWNDSRTLLGLMGQPVPGPHASKPMTGLATIGLKASLRDDAFDGEPDGYSIIDGQLLYDARKDSTVAGGSGPQRLNDPSTYTYSTNPITAAMNVALGRRLPNGKLFWGVGCELAELDLPAWLAAANVADLNNWTCGGVVTTGDNAYAVITQLLAAGGAKPIARGSQLGLVQSAPKVSVLTITADDIVGSVRISTSTGLRDRINRVVPVCRDPNQFYEMVDQAAVQPAAYLAEDGGVSKSEKFELPLSNNRVATTQLAAYFLVDSREFITVDLTGKPRLLNADVGDAVTVDAPDLAINGMKMVVQSRDWKASDQTVAMSLRVETDAKHEFALGRTAVAPPTPALSGFDKTNPDAPGVSAWSITDTAIVAADGSKAPAIVLNGASDNPRTDSIQFHHRVLGVPTWTSSGAVEKATTRFEITGLEAGQKYETGVSYTVGAYASAITALPVVTVGTAIASGVRDGGIPWAGSGPGPIADVPPALDVDEDGKLDGGNVTSGVPGKTVKEFNTDQVAFNAQVRADQAAADQSIDDGLAAEAAARAALETTLKAADQTIRNTAATTKAALEAADQTIRNSVTAEATARGQLKTALEAADQAIRDTAATTKTALEAADQTIRNSVTAEGTARGQLKTALEAADAAIRTSVTAEATARGQLKTALEAADATLTAKTADLDARLSEAFEALGEGEDGQIGTRITAVEQRASTLETDKASVSDLNAVKTRVTTAEGTITSQNTRLTTAETNIAGKASNSDFQTLKTEVTTARGSATSLNNRLNTTDTTIAGKASTQSVTDLTTRVTSVEGVNTAQNTRLSTAEVELGKKALATDLTALQGRVTTAETDLSATNTKLNTVETTANNAAKASDVTTLTSTVNTKPQTFAQGTAPSSTGRITGDLWVNTVSNNQLNRWSGSAWVAVHDVRGADALAELAAARNGSTSLNAQLQSMRQTSTDLASGKTNVSDFNALTTRVATAEGVNSAQNTRLNTAETDIAGKASAQSVSDLSSSVVGLTTRVGATETATADLAAKKADATRVTSLEARASDLMAKTLPSTFENGSEFFTTGDTGNTWTGFNLIDTDKGKAWKLTGSTFRQMRQKGSLPAVVGRTYRATAIVKNTTADTTARPWVRLVMFNAAGAKTDGPGTYASGGTAWETITSTFKVTNAAHVEIRAEAILNYKGGAPGNTVDVGGTVAMLLIEDITADDLTARVTTTESATANLATNKADASRVTTLENAINAPTTGLNAKVSALQATTTSLASDKANVTDLTALTGRVTTAESDITATRTKLNTVETTANAAAKATDLTALTTRVTTAEGVNTAQNTRLNTAESDIAGKASAQSVSDLNTSVLGLTTRVGATETATSNLATQKADATRVTTLEAVANTQSAGLWPSNFRLVDNVFVGWTPQLDSLTPGTTAPAGATRGVRSVDQFGEVGWFNGNHNFAPLGYKIQAVSGRVYRIRAAVRTVVDRPDGGESTTYFTLRGNNSAGTYVGTSIGAFSSRGRVADGWRFTDYYIKITDAIIAAGVTYIKPFMSVNSETLGTGRGESEVAYFETTDATDNWDAKGSNLFTKGVWDNADLGYWTGSTVVADDGPPGLNRKFAIRNSTWDAVNGDLKPGNWQGRKFRATGWVKVPTGTIRPGIGIIGQNTAGAGTNNAVSITGFTNDVWFAFDVIVNATQPFVTARPFIRSDPAHGCLWTDLRLEDITEAQAVDTKLTSVTARVGTVETATASLQTGKADATRVTTLEAKTATLEKSDLIDKGLILPSADAWSNYPSSPETSPNMTYPVTTVDGKPSIILGDNQHVFWKKAVRVEPDHVYEIRVEAEPSTANNATIGLGFWQRDSKFVAFGTPEYQLASKTVTERAFYVHRFTPRPGTYWIKPAVKGNTVNSYSPRIFSLECIDVTATVAAETNTALTARVTTTETATTNLQTQKADASRVTTLENAINAPSTGLDAKVSALQATATQLGTDKANASDLTALQGRMTTAENDLTATNTRLNTIETTANSAAKATDLTALTTRVSSAEGVNTAQNTRLTTAESNIAGKASAQSVTDLSSSVAVRNRTFRQSAAPTSPAGGYPLIAGDTWINTTTGQNNALSIWTGSAWTTAVDPRIATSAQGVTDINAKIGTVSGTVADALSGKASASDLTALTGRVTTAEGSLTAQNTRLNTVETGLNGKASAQSVTDLTSTVNTKPQTFAQATAPSSTGRITGDLWANTSANNQLNRWSGTAWVVVHDVRGADALAELTAARNGSANLNAQLQSMRQTTTDGLAGKASASDFTALTTRVTNTETVNTAQNTRLNTAEADIAGKASAQSVTNLNSTVNGLSGRMTTVETTTANLQTNKAEASRVTQLEVSNRSSMNTNSDFAQPGTGTASQVMPTGWIDQEYGWRYTIVPGVVSANALRYVTTANENVMMSSYARRSTRPGYFVLRAVVRLVAGSFGGAGVHTNLHLNGQYQNNNAASLSFQSELGNGEPGRVYTVEKLVLINTPMDTIEVFAMTNWDGLGARSAKTIEWHECSVREATEAEIKSGGGVTNDLAYADATTGILPFRPMWGGASGGPPNMQRNDNGSVAVWKTGGGTNDGGGVSTLASVEMMLGTEKAREFEGAIRVYKGERFCISTKVVAQSGTRIRTSNMVIPRLINLAKTDLIATDASPNGPLAPTNYITVGAFIDIPEDGYLGCEICMRVEAASTAFGDMALFQPALNRVAPGVTAIPAWRKPGTADTPNAARLSMIEQVISKAGNLKATWAVAPSVPGANSFIRAQAENADGTPTSDVGIGAKTISLYNPQGDDWRLAMRVESGNAIFTGGLQAGVSIRLGNGKGWPVALRPESYDVSDGDVISFGTDLGNIPNITLGLNGLAPLSPGEAYDVRATNLTATGFTAYVKINVPAVPGYQSYTGTGSTGSVNGVSVRFFTLDTRPESASGAYQVKATGYTSITIRAQQQPEDFFGDGLLRIYVLRNNVWSEAAIVPYNWSAVYGNGTNSARTENPAWQINTAVQLGSGVQGIAVGHVGGVEAGNRPATISAIGPVSWTSQGTGSSIRSATPNGQKTRFTVTPQ